MMEVKKHYTFLARGCNYDKQNKVELTNCICCEILDFNKDYVRLYIQTYKKRTENTK